MAGIFTATISQMQLPKHPYAISVWWHNQNSGLPVAHVLTVTISQLHHTKHPVYYSGLMAHSEYRVTYSSCSYSNNLTTTNTQNALYAIAV